jgi:hypothetical protein
MRSARRLALLEQAAHDRRQIAVSLAALSGPIQRVERGWSVLQWLRRRPYLAGGALAVVSLLGRRRLLKLPQLALGGWQIARVVARLVAASRTSASRT